jgi:hypothetical protein
MKTLLVSSRVLAMAIILTTSGKVVEAQIHFGLNVIGGSESSVAAGDSNTNNGNSSTIGGGQNNGNYADLSFIGAGYGNFNGGYADFLGGGVANNLSVNSSLSAICGGAENLIDDSGAVDFIGAGLQNSIVGNGDGFSVIGGGYDNAINAPGGNATIGGGGYSYVGAYYSTIAGGYYNTNVGEVATIGGGGYNRVTADFATVPGGALGFARSYGQFAHANGSFVASGVAIEGGAQASEYVLWNETTNTTTTQLFLDGQYGGNQQMLVPNNGTWMFDVMVVVRDANGNSAGFKTNGVVKNFSGTTSLNGTTAGTISIPAIYSDLAGWTASVSADNVNKSLKITVNGFNSTNRWVATVHTTEVLF